MLCGIREKLTFPAVARLLQTEACLGGYPLHNLGGPDRDLLVIDGSGHASGLPLWLTHLMPLWTLLWAERIYSGVELIISLSNFYDVCPKGSNCRRRLQTWSPNRNPRGLPRQAGRRA